MSVRRPGRNRRPRCRRRGPAVPGAFFEVDFAHRDAEIAVPLARDENLARGRERAGGDLRLGTFLAVGGRNRAWCVSVAPVNDRREVSCGGILAQRRGSCPYAGTTRIRFEGLSRPSERAISQPLRRGTPWTAGLSTGCHTPVKRPFPSEAQSRCLGLAFAALPYSVVLSIVYAKIISKLTAAKQRNISGKTAK